MYRTYMYRTYMYSAHMYALYTTHTYTYTVWKENTIQCSSHETGLFKEWNASKIS